MVAMRTAKARLKRLFAERGYVRRQSPAQLMKYGYEGYKKGSEVRLPLVSKAEVREVQGYLKQAGFRPGKPFSKHGRFIQPIYGSEAVEWFTS